MTPAYLQAQALGADCKNCPLQGKPHGEPVFPKPNSGAKMIICGEGPGKSEEAFEEYFMGPSGDFLHNMLQFLNIPFGKLHITNATMCRPRQELPLKDWNLAVKCCQPRLVRELQGMKAKSAMAYGGRAFQSLTGIKSQKVRHYHGMPREAASPFSPKLQVLSAYHPAFVIRPENGHFTPSVFEFTKRCWEVARGRFTVPEWPRIIIHPGQEALDALKHIAESKQHVGFDVEMRGQDPLSSACMCLSVANPDVAVSLPWERYFAGKHGDVEGLEDYPRWKSHRRAVGRILRNSPLVLQNGPVDLLTAERMGLPWRRYAFDTLLAHAVVAQGVHHDLGYIAALETQYPRWKTEFHATTHEKGIDAFAKRHPECLRTYNAKDAWMTLILKEPLEERLDEVEGGRGVFKSYMKNIHVAIDMQRSGVRSDTSRFGDHTKILKRRMQYAANQVYEISTAVGIETLNLNSTPQMGHFFFKRLGVKPKYRSKETGKPSLNEKALSDLITNENVFIRTASRATLRYRKNKKLLEYLSLGRVTNESFTHITWNPHGARTMRWSSSPNLQNIPKPVKEKVKRGPNKGTWRTVAPGLRDIYVAHHPGDWIVCADYDQLELRIAALLANDQPLIDVFNRGEDPHAVNAASMFGYDDPAEVEKAERDVAKVWIYQYIYGGAAEAIWKHVSVDFPSYSLRQSYRNRESFAKAHPAFQIWHDTSFARAREEKSIRAPLSGHRLEFYGRVEAAKVYNYPAQHTAADILNPAIPRVAKALDWEREFIVAQVHDELVCCGPNPVKLGKMLIDKLETRVTINGKTLPFTAGVKMGPSYGEVEELKKGESLTAGAKRIGEQYKERFAFLKRWGRALRTQPNVRATDV